MHVGNRIPRKAPRSATGQQPVLVERSALASRLREMQQATPASRNSQASDWPSTSATPLARKSERTIR
jgi:hypothetical protein